MADITNPQAVLFCNDYVRTRANDTLRAYERARSLLLEWDSTGMSALIPNNVADTVIDGSAQDGRTPITGRDVNNLVEVYLRSFVADLEANANTKLNILSAIATRSD